jgi:hypothetical protein
MINGAKIHLLHLNERLAPQEEALIFAYIEKRESDK